jgi:trk system potassium uptake protein
VTNKGYSLNILAVGQARNFDLNPQPNQRLDQDDIFVVIGNPLDLDRLPL